MYLVEILLAVLIITCFVGIHLIYKIYSTKYNKASSVSQTDEFEPDIEDDLSKETEVNPEITYLQGIIDGFIEASTVPVQCPCGEEVLAIVTMNGDNTFECIKCKSKFRTELIQSPVLITEPINLERAFDILKNIAVKSAEKEL